MHIYDVTNPQGFFFQSKVDVKCKQHLVLSKTIYSLPSFLSFCLSLYQWQLATVGKPSKKRNVIGLNLHLPTPLVTHFIPQPPNPCFCSREQKPFLSITLSVVSSRSAKLSHNVYDPTTNRNCFKTIGHIANHLHLCSNLNVPRGSLHLTLNSNRMK